MCFLVHKCQTVRLGSTVSLADSIWLGKRNAVLMVGFVPEDWEKFQPLMLALNVYAGFGMDSEAETLGIKGIELKGRSGNIKTRPRMTPIRSKILFTKTTPS